MPINARTGKYSIIPFLMPTASVIAIVELASAHADIPAVQVKPQTAKADTGIGAKASKEQVTRVVNRLLSADIRNGHESDAAAVAIAGLLHS